MARAVSYLFTVVIFYNVLVQGLLPFDPALEPPATPVTPDIPETPVTKPESPSSPVQAAPECTTLEPIYKEEIIFEIGESVWWVGKIYVGSNQDTPATHEIPTHQVHLDVEPPWNLPIGEPSVPGIHIPEDPPLGHIPENPPVAGEPCVPGQHIPEDPPLGQIPEKPPVVGKPINLGIHIPEDPPLGQIPENPPVVGEPCVPGQHIPEDPPLGHIPENPPVAGEPCDPAIHIPEDPPLGQIPENPPVSGEPWVPGADIPQTPPLGVEPPSITCAENKICSINSYTPDSCQAIKILISRNEDGLICLKQAIFDKVANSVSLINNMWLPANPRKAVFKQQFGTYGVMDQAGSIIMANPAPAEIKTAQEVDLVLMGVSKTGEWALLSTCCKSVVFALYNDATVSTQTMKNFDEVIALILPRLGISFEDLKDVPTDMPIKLDKFIPDLSPTPATPETPEISATPAILTTSKIPVSP